MPLICIRADVDEDAIAADFKRGARDTVSFNNAVRLHAVVERELRTHRLERALHGTLRSAQDYRRQLETVLLKSNDAIVQIQEGILVEANASWLELVGVEEADAITGQPIMDFFDEANHPALKGALIACQQGRWSDHTLRVNTIVADGSSVPLELVLALGERDGEPCVRLIVPAQLRDERHLETDLADAVRRNPRTGLLYRQPLLEALAKRLETSLQGGGRYLAVIRPDKFAELERDLGVGPSEEFLVQLASLVRAQSGPNDIVGHLSGPAQLVMFERGNARDAEAWTEQVAEHVAKHVFTVGDKSIRSTVTAGRLGRPRGCRWDRRRDCRCARRGPQGPSARRQPELPRRQGRRRHARAELRRGVGEAHPRGAHRQPLPPRAAAGGDAGGRRQPDVRRAGAHDRRAGQGRAAVEFMPAAERNDLVRNIDRWVISAAFSFAVQRKPGCLFVRLSRGSAIDPSLLAWLDVQLQVSKVDPQRICIQVTEDIAAKHVQEITRLANGLRERSLRFALDHFGVGRDPTRLIENLPLDFLKIDGSLMQGLPSNPELQAKVRAIVDAAAKRGIETIAERVEDANTMAVLWQLGVQYLQGYLFNAPEDVVIEAR